MQDMREIERMTPYEYSLRIRAYRRAQVEREYDIHMLAYQTFRAQSTKRRGKDGIAPVYPTFKKFYDYEAALRELDGEKAEPTGIGARVMAYRRAREQEENG